MDKIPIIRDRLDDDTREVISGASVAFVVKLLGAALSFGFNVVLARMLGADGAGVYILTLTVITAATTISTLGLQRTLIRFTAGNAVRGNWSAVSGIYRSGMRLSVSVAAMVTVVVFASAPGLAELIFSEPRLAVAVRGMALAIVPMVFLTLQAAMFTALKRIRDAELINTAGVPALSLLGLYWLGRAWGIMGAVWSYVLAAGLTAAFGLWMWRVTVPELRQIDGSQIDRAYDRQTLLASSIPLLWVSIMQFITARVATLLLGIWGTSAEVAVFGMAARAALLTSFVLLAVNSIAAPKFAAFFEHGDDAAVQSTAQSAVRMIVLFAGPMLVLFLLFPRWVMGLFGPQFEAGATVLMILAAGQLVNMLTGPVGPLLIMSGNEAALRNNMFLGAIVHLILSLIMIPNMGALGAAIATTISLVILQLHAVYLVWTQIKVWPVPIPMIR